MTYSYDRTAAVGGEDTDSLFDGFYDPKMTPKNALDLLVQAYRSPVDDFLQRWQAQLNAAEKFGMGDLAYNQRKLYGLIVNYLLDQYHMEKALAQGFAQQIVFGHNS